MTAGGPARRPWTVGAGLVPLLLATAGGAAAQDFAPATPAGATVTADRTDPAQVFDVAVGPATATAPVPLIQLAAGPGAVILRPLRSSTDFSGKLVQMW